MLLLDGIPDFVAIILKAVGDDGPTVVLTGLDAVSLIATAGSEFTLPKAARNGLECQPLHIAVAVRIDFGTGIITAFKRISLCRLTIRCDSKDQIGRAHV